MMEKRAVKLMKRIMSSIVAVAMIIVGSFTIDAKVNAADGDIVVDKETGIAYQEFDNYTDYIEKSIPTYGGTDTEGYGYVFGGWFIKSDDENTYKPIATSDEADNKTVYAKFVPAYVLSVKCQNQAGTAYTNEGNGSTKLKVVSSVDSVNYSAYGFDLFVITLDENGNYASEKAFSSNGETGTKVYEEFNIYDDTDTTKLIDTKTPSAVFGKASKYFTTWSINNIKEGSYGTIICVKPYWVTKDSMKVYGLTKYAHVEDGLLHTDSDGTKYRYVNVPVNIRDTKAVAAGMLSVNYSDSADFELYEVEGGVVFEEMAWTDKGTSVKLVGNVKNIENNKQLNDIYANLRFKVQSSSASDFSNGYSFAVTGEEFSDNAETQYTSTAYDVWNVKY